ncbi:MAG: chromate transporter [Clostridia bacterium]|nr:chromate transporter [Clostridia bacterium]
MKKHLYLNLFFRSLLLSASTIGGGFVIISVMRRIYVVKLGWLTEEEMLDITSLAQTCPGAVAVNASVLAGHRLGGIPGAVLSAAGTVLPPLCIMSLIAAVYAGISSGETIGKLMLGMQAGVAAVLLDTALVLTKKTLSEGPARIGVFVLALSAAVFTGISSAFIILGAAAVGILLYAVGRKEA